MRLRGGTLNGDFHRQFCPRDHFIVKYNDPFLLDELGIESFFSLFFFFVYILSFSDA